MKEKIKVGDIIRYNGTGLFGDDIQIIGYVIDTSFSNNFIIPIEYYKVIVLKENKKHSSLIGKTMTINDYFGTLIKIY